MESCNLNVHVLACLCGCSCVRFVCASLLATTRLKSDVRYCLRPSSYTQLQSPSICRSNLDCAQRSILHAFILTCNCVKYSHDLITDTFGQKTKQNPDTNMKLLQMHKRMWNNCFIMRNFIFPLLSKLKRSNIIQNR